MAALLRLVELEEGGGGSGGSGGGRGDGVGGEILVDGVDVRDVPLPLLRGRVAILPQEPTLFSGTIRSNLDPTDHSGVLKAVPEEADGVGGGGARSDEELWEALAKVLAHVRVYVARWRWHAVAGAAFSAPLAQVSFVC